MRYDEWGGSYQNRIRFPVEIVKAIREAVGKEFIIIFRLSMLDLVEQGSTFEEVVVLAKALEEATAHYLYLTKKLKVTTIRFFNTVGPRQTGKYGMVIPRFVRAAIENQSLKIFGDGTQTRVFCHVSDSVKAILGLAENHKTIGEVFNVGGRGEISIAELAKMIIELTNSKSKITFIPYQDAYTNGFEEMRRRVPDVSKIASYIGWRPDLDLNTIIEDIIKSYR
jgi:UDP-glucose 4-epimerase